MTGTRYREITDEQFNALMVDMGFFHTNVLGALEHVYERVINYKNGAPSPFVIRIFSSVHKVTGVTRECGSDAIRVILLDKVRDRPVLDFRVYRTENAFTNLRERAREAWAYATNPHHRCRCDALMVTRSSSRGSFLGCSNFPVCRETRKLVAEAVAA